MRPCKTGNQSPSDLWDFGSILVSKTRIIAATSDFRMHNIIPKSNKKKISAKMAIEMRTVMKVKFQPALEHKGS